MKVFIFYLFCSIGILQAAGTYAQNARLSLNVNQETVGNALKQIEAASDFDFFYNNTQLDLQRRVTVSEENSDIFHILDEVFAGTDVRYTVLDNKIILSNELKDQQVTQQGNVIQGRVTDANGEPVIGASVLEEGTQNGVITDMDGNFRLTVKAGAKIRVSYIGFTDQLITVKAGTNQYDIVLKEDNKLLDEVVVVGYGTQKKVNLTGSVASVSTEDIKDRVQTDVLSSIQGTVPGVTIISRPGQTPSINFRGRGNLGTSEPLYVIDGAIADATFFSNLDPNSIESISFLKDAASSAIYGSRAAYGVVLVTTKAGKEEKMTVTYNGYVGMKMPTYLPDLISSAEYATLLNEAMYNRNPDGGWNQAYTDEEIGWFADGSRPDYYPNTDWIDLTMDKHVLTTKHSINVSGGTKKVRYFIGTGYMYDDKFTRGQDSKRYNLNMNLTSDITDWLSVSAGVKYIRNENDTDHGVPSFTNYLLVPSIMVGQQSDGEWGSIAGGQQATVSFITGNPLRAMHNNNWSTTSFENSMYHLNVSLKPIKDLVITGGGSYKRYEYKYKGYTALRDEVPLFGAGTPISGTGNDVNQMSMSWSSHSVLQTQLTANYHHTWGEHDFTALAGTSYEHRQSQALSASRKNFPSDSFEDMSGGSNAGTDITNGSSMSEYKMMSYFGRVNYAFKGRYLFEANVRADASSRFHPDNRWGVFPSFSVGWRLSEESFMDNLTWLDNLKVRASYGTLGNINNVGNYDYFQLYNKGSNYTFDEQLVSGIYESRPANRELGWEKVAITDIGLDADLFNGHFSLVADYYIKNTSDILLSYNVPAETGISTAPSQNIGKVRNKGFELALTYREQIGKDFRLTLGGNIAVNKNEIIDLAGSDNMIQAGGDKINYILKEGESIGSYYGFKTDGLYTQEEIDAGHYYTFGRVPNAGDIKYVPQREGVEWGDAITDEDRTIIGCDVPKFTYGLNLTLNYKDFELSLFGQGTSGTNVAFESEQVWAFFLNSNPRKYHLNRWTVDNPNPHALYPRIYGGSSLDDYNQNFSDFQIFDADYFRIKTISLGYQIPKELTNKWGLETLKFFLTGENLFTFREDHKMKDFDPETVSGRSVSALGVKSVAFGVNLSF
ncbi:MAG TPA: TonB-dependent receptor [Candidatus Bacteroides pullicola]|uniref:TonB-dependent receptor n=1 Tax=Candidatus Bacteroides pullicola TaxID=2838475 RepID=A0A9D1ZK60_9BACE|nr:TonB-dependent receptor [Candidatus Bacteroides pullicola]